LRVCTVGITEARGFSIYAAEMGSSAKIYILSFIEIGSDIQTFLGAIHTDTQTAR
jgi:hypothetical protein